MPKPAIFVSLIKNKGRRALNAIKIMNTQNINIQISSENLKKAWVQAENGRKDFAIMYYQFALETAQQGIEEFTKAGLQSPELEEIKAESERGIKFHMFGE